MKSVTEFWDAMLSARQKPGTSAYFPPFPRTIATMAWIGYVVGHVITMPFSGYNDSEDDEADGDTR